MDVLSFCYKGSRTYVHGTDMYNTACRYLHASGISSVQNIDFAIHRLTTNNLKTHVWPVEEIPPDYDPSVSLRFAQGGQQFVMGLFETDVPITCRYPYDEDSIAQSSTLSPQNRSIALQNSTPYTSIEVIVALNKVLMQTLFADVPGKWYFTRLRLKEELPVATNSAFLLKQTRSLGSRLTQSQIFMNEVSIGDIFFSLVTMGDKL